MSDQAKAEAEAKAKKEAEEKAAAEKAEADKKAAADKEAADKKAKAEAEAKAKAKRATFHVVGPGAVRFDGTTYPAGEELELTEVEAQGLGAAVAKGKAPPKAEDMARRKAGRYRVAGPGSVWYAGAAREAGFEFDCDEAEARRLGASIVPA